MHSKKEREFHLRMATLCFNETWEYLEKERKRTDMDNQKMLLLAHASRYHWDRIGTSRNKAVGDWQISRVYAALKQPSLALLFAKSSLEICKEKKLSEVLVTAYEAVARAYSVAGNQKSAMKYLKLARDQLEALDLDDEDREVYLGQINDSEKLIAR